MPKSLLVVFVTAIVFASRPSAVEVVGRKLTIQHLNGSRKHPGVAADGPVLCITLELVVEERRCSRRRDVCQYRQFVIAYGFGVQATAVSVLVMFRQGGDEFRLPFTLLGAAFRSCGLSVTSLLTVQRRCHRCRRDRGSCSR